MDIRDLAIIVQELEHRVRELEESHTAQVSKLSKLYNAVNEFATGIALTFSRQKKVANGGE